MKRIQTIVVILCLSMGVVATTPAEAEWSPQFGQFIHEQMSATSESLASSENVCVLDGAQNEAYYLQNFLVRVRAQFGIEIPLFLKFLIVPEVELVFQRRLPEGWGSYKPN